MTTKERYAQFCQETPDLPIFMQDWWMDAVCAGKQWEVLFCRKTQDGCQVSDNGDTDGEIIAVMPYLLRKRAWMKYIVMPQQTQIGGIWISSTTLLDSEVDVTTICEAFTQYLKRVINYVCLF